MAYGVIYKITNTRNGKSYVGKHAKPGSVFMSGDYYGSGIYLRAAIKKHGRDVFTREIVEDCECGSLNARERYWIAALNTRVPNGYNIAKGGDGPLCVGVDTRIKISNSLKGHIPWNKGIPATDAQKAKQRESMTGKRAGMLGKRHSAETKNKIRAKVYGYVHTDAARRKMSIATTGRVFSDAHRLKISENSRKQMIGKPAWNKGRALSEWHRASLRNAWIERKTRNNYEQ